MTLHPDDSAAAPVPASRPAPRRRPTMRDIAAEAGVSKGLVSMILSGAPGPSAATTEKVLAIAGRLNYRTDRAATLLSRRRTRLLGVTTIPSNAFHGELVDAIQSTLEEAGYDMVLGSMTHSDDERRSIETLIGFRCEGLLLIGPVLPAADLAGLVAGIPCVCLGRAVDKDDGVGGLDGVGGMDGVGGIDVVRADDDSGMDQLVDHLVGLGHRGIVHVDGGSGAIAAHRRRAFRAAMQRHGLGGRVVTGGLTERDGARAVDALDLPATRPPTSLATSPATSPATEATTAVVAFNDRCALGVLDRLDAAGIDVPQDVSVTGFDDSIVARLRRINLTTVNQAPQQQAQLAVRSLIDRLDTGRTEPHETVLPCRLVVRGSTGPRNDDVILT